jgi:hypothetical protein
MKFLYTADWQIGMRAAHVGAAGTRVRQNTKTSREEQPAESTFSSSLS